MKRFAWLLVLTLATVAGAWGQSAAELYSRYSTIEVYKISPSVWMTPSYAVDGQVCRMVLEKRHMTKENDETVISQSSSFSESEIQELLDELVPAPERGERLTGKWLDSTIAGHSIST